MWRTVLQIILGPAFYDVQHVYLWPVNLVTIICRHYLNVYFSGKISKLQRNRHHLQTRLKTSTQFQVLGIYKRKLG
jgi:hypothetical protein